MPTTWQIRLRKSGTESRVFECLTDCSQVNVERLMTWLCALAGPVIDLDGMCLPLVRDGVVADDVLLSATRHALNREVQWRSGSETESERRRIYPGRYLRFRLEASYMARIAGLTTVEVRNYLKLGDEPEWKGTRADPRRTRSRSADRVITQGDRDWARLGAWPYAVFGERRLPADWRVRPETSEALAEYMSHACP